MFGLNLDSSIFIIIIVCYGLYLIIQNKFGDVNNNIVEGFKPIPQDSDPYDKKFKPVLNQNINDMCNRKIKSDCMPYPIDYQPEEKPFVELKEGTDNIEGRNFLFAKHHSQIDNVGTFKRNKKVDIRPELINPQLGVDPWTQSIINVAWNKDDKSYKNPNETTNIWDKLTIV
jgi:hypothetical protein